jgi:hypothetical protein
MAGLLKWIKNSSSALLDPGRDARIKHAASHVEHELASQRDAFSFGIAVRSLELFPEDLPLVRKEAYRSLLARAWRDGRVSSGEQKTLTWAGSALGLTSTICEQLMRETGLRAFEEILARSLDDGVLSEDEIAALQSTAAGVGLSLPSLMRQYFSDASAGLLRGMFVAAVEDATLPQQWSQLTAIAERFGMSKADLLAATQQQAEHLVEQTLAEAKADGTIAAQEQGVLDWLLSNIIGRAEFRFYVQNEVAEVKALEAISKGHLPSLQTNRLGLRAGEIVHAETPAQFRRTRQVKSGPRTDFFDGDLVLTDDRLFFQSPQLGLEVNHRRVLDIKQYSNGFELTVSGKGTGVYMIAGDAIKFSRIYAVAVKKANQTVVVAADRETMRHIPRDVRQRVWQRYGGRCVQCGAGDYLEFDHIIPVAKGGSNTELNVQLLCRRCNNTKSDAI